VFEELGIHHEEHVVPSKVLASIEKKQKAAAKNATVAAESKKRKGQAGLKTLSKKHKIEATSIVSASPATSFASTSEEGLVEDTGGAQDAFAKGDVPVNLASAGGGGAEATKVTGEGTESLMGATMVSVEVVGAYVGDPFPDVLGGDSSPDASKAPPHGGQSPIHAVEAPRTGARRIVAQVSEEEEDMPDAVWLAACATFPLHLSKGVIPFCCCLVYVFFFPTLFLPKCLFVSVGSMTGNLASKEELTTGSRIGYAGLGMPLPPPPTVEPSPQPTGLNLEAPTCEL
jgi:hypothetical protein